MSNYEQNVQSIRNTFTLFFNDDSNNQPEISSFSFQLASVMMQMFKNECRTFKVAVKFMESLTDLNPQNAGEWLGDVSWDLLETYFNPETPNYSAVINAMHKRFEIPYNDLKLGETTAVSNFLQEYKQYI